MKYKSILFVALLFYTGFSGTNVYAQTKDSLIEFGKIYKHQKFPDSSLNPSDSSLSSKYGKENPPDLRWKKDREFSYMRYLDSLLRNQKNMRNDTVRVDEKSGRIKRKPRKLPGTSPFINVLNSWPLRTFFWTLAILFIGFISYKVFYKNGIFRKKKKITEEEEEDSLHELNELSEYDHLIDEAENTDLLNLATRYLFLKTLKNLSDKNLIHFTSEKTNKEYLIEMQSHTYFEAFKKLTHDYEYVWYGKFRISKQDYQKLKEDFVFFNTKV